MERYKEREVRLCFRGDAAFASPEIYEYLEAEAMLYAIRLPANKVLQESIAHLLTRLVGRPPNHVRRYYASFSYQAGSWDRTRRVVAKVKWHPGELYPRVGFIVTNLRRPAEHPSQRLAIDIGKHRDPPATIESDLHPAARRGLFMTSIIAAVRRPIVVHCSGWC